MSPSTVARYLNNSGYVSETNRQKIKAVIDENIYIPNKAAQGLKRNRTMTLGLITSESYPNMYFARVEGPLSAAADRAGYTLISMTSSYNYEKERQIIKSFAGSLVDGIIFNSPFSGERIEYVLQYNIPTLFVERLHGHREIDGIKFDDIEVGRLAADEFITNGHKKIAFIGMNKEDDVEYERFKGFDDCLKDHGISIKEAHVVYIKYNEMRYGYEGAKQLLSAGDEITALFVTGDLTLCGVLQYLYEKKIAVPDDISLIGLDNTYSEMCSPKISTIGFPYDVLADEIFAMITNRIDDRTAKPVQKTLAPLLIRRDSVRDLKKN